MGLLQVQVVELICPRAGLLQSSTLCKRSPICGRRRPPASLGDDSEGDGSEAALSNRGLRHSLDEIHCIVYKYMHQDGRSTPYEQA